MLQQNLSESYLLANAGENFICEFAAWALEEKELMPSTVTSYLSSLSTIQELKGFKNHNCLTPLAKKVIRGAQNLRFYANMCKCTRKVITLPMLKLIGHEIEKSDWTKNSKQVLWSACITAFLGHLD
jgi:Leucine-rich repeat (LRR) protein